jgi:cellobiose transport system permease protein
VQDPDFWWSVVNTFEIWVMATVPMLFLALVIAVLLNSQIRFKTAYRIAFFIPNITSIVALTVIFGSIFANNFGLLNGMLEALGVDRVEWLNQPWGIKFAIAVMVIWRWTGYNAIIFLAGLQAIPPDIFEAAKIDGAGAVQTFFRVTIPSLRPVILFAVIMSTVGGLQIFTEPQVLFGDSTGGTGGAGQTIVLYLYDQAFTRSDFGYAAAIGWALFLILILFSIINWRLVQRPGDR